MAWGETARDPEGPDGEKPFPVPLQEVALALVQVIVDGSPFHIEVGDADSATVGAGCELATCPVIDSVETTKPSPVVVSSVLLNIISSLALVGLDLRGIRNG